MRAHTHPYTARHGTVGLSAEAEYEAVISQVNKAGWSQLSALSVPHRPQPASAYHTDRRPLANKQPRQLPKLGIREELRSPSADHKWHRHAHRHAVGYVATHC